MRQKFLILGLVIFLLAGGVIAWPIAGLPPPKYLLRYGLSPGCEPTGETVTFDGVEFVEIGPGILRMGSDKLAEGGDWVGRICAALGLPWGKRPEPSNEMPVRWVEFPRGFWIARTEVTNEQYERFDPKHERCEYSDGDDDPVAGVSWEKAKHYCAWLSEKSGREIRLPSESEWECACRAGSETEYCFGDEEPHLGEYAWFKANSDGRAHPVGTKLRNEWGLSDMHGNVGEWCEDTWHESYEGAPMDGSSWTEGVAEWRPGSPRRVSRGGFWGNSAAHCRSSFRSADIPVVLYWYLGFRPAFVVSDR